MTKPAADQRRPLARRNAGPISSPVEASAHPPAAPADAQGASTAERLYAVLAEARRIGGDPALCEAFRLLGECTGENKFRYAASLIGGSRPGRTAIDDGEALRRVAAFRPDRRCDAVGLVARQMAGGDAAKADTIAHRLHRKLREKSAK